MISKYISYEPAEIKEYALANACTATQYIGWINIYSNFLDLRIWAFRKTKGKGFQIREVIRAENTSDKILIRCMYLTPMNGWKVFYSPKDARVTSWYGYEYYSVHKEDFEVWDTTYQMPGIFYKILNPEALKGTYFEYCGYQRGDIYDYIRLWEKHPSVEFFGKNDMKPSKAIINLIEKDKAFGKWIAKQNIEEIKECGVESTLWAYRHHMTIQDAYEIRKEKHEAVAACRFLPSVKQSGLDKVKVYRYLRKNNVRAGRYDDYIEACIGLELDLNDTKNSFPKEFERMHELRTSQWGSKKQKIKKSAFKNACKKYKPFEYSGKKYCVIIPNGIRDLQHEGAKLHHCVGKMGYDKKMVDGISFIAFIRKNKEKDVPFVTVEYSNRRKQIVQIYGDHDSNPKADVIEFAKEWEGKVKAYEI